ncbi:MAG: hypothetical protein IIC51_00045 [Planctomycetes bacterium]|nr:hypothetical protein [Planctomycetota bacterium]
MNHENTKIHHSLAKNMADHRCRYFDPDKPKQGYVVVQGSSSTVNLVSVLPQLEAQGITVKLISAISEDLFRRQSQAYQDSVLPPGSRYDLMIVSTGTKRVWPIQNVGPLTDDYSMVSDWNDEWLTGGTEQDVIAEAHLDAASILKGVKRFALDHDARISGQRDQLASLQ